MITPLPHLIITLVYPVVRVFLTFYFEFLIVVMILVTVRYLHLCKFRTSGEEVNTGNVYDLGLTRPCPERDWNSGFPGYDVKLFEMLRLR